MANIEYLPLSLVFELSFSNSIQEHGSTIVGVDLQITPEESENGGFPSYLAQLLEFTSSMDGEVLNVVGGDVKNTKIGKWRKQRKTKLHPNTSYFGKRTRCKVTPATKIYNESAKAGLVALLKNAKCKGQSARTVIKPLSLSHLEVYILEDVSKDDIIREMLAMLGCPDKE